MMKASRMAKIVLVTYREWEEERQEERAEQERTGQRKIKTLIIFSTLQAAIGFAFISLWYENRFAEN